MPQFTLMKHQQEGVRFLDRVDGIGALLFDPGVGKTGTTLAWIDKQADKHREFRVLVVAPLTAADTWVLQAPPFMDSPVKARMLQGSTVSIMKRMASAKTWGGVPKTPIMSDHPGIPAKQRAGNRVTILSMSAGAISNFCSDRNKTVQMLQAVRKYAPHLIVVDESHIIKSATSTISEAMYQIGQIADHRIILTGTVTPLGPLDVYGQWRFLAPWTFSSSYDEPFTKKPLDMTKAEKASVKPWPWYRMKTRYTIPGGYQGKGIGGYQNLAELNDRVAERSMVVKKEDALDLPPVRDVDVHVTLSAKEAKAYKQMSQELVAELEDGTMVEAVNALAKMMKLRQVAGGFIKDTESGEVHVIGDSLRKAITEIVSTTLGGEDRVVVFAYFRRECELLVEALGKSEKAAGRPDTVIETITGGTKNNDRLAIRQRFGDVSGNPTRTILVAQQRTMSVSVNELVTAQNAVFGSMSERSNDWVQARGRLDRNGQKGQHVTFWNVYSPGLIGEIMLNRHVDHGDLEKSLLDHIRKVAASTR